MNKIIAILVLIGVFLPIRVSALRLWTSGAELNSVATDMEFRQALGSPTIVTSPVHSGTYSIYAAGGDQDQVEHIFTPNTLDSGPYYFRAYVYVDNYPNNATPSATQHSLIRVSNSSGIQTASIRLNSNGSLDLIANSSTISGSIVTVTLDTWHRIELYVRRLSPTELALQGMLDGVIFASTVSSTETNYMYGVRFGFSGGSTAGDLYVDDVAVNDGSGGKENSYPGNAKAVVHFRPSSGGDADGCSTIKGWDRVDEITPNDAADFCLLNDKSDELSVNASSSAQLGIGGTDYIKFVQMGNRAKAVSIISTSTDYFIKSQSGGTKIVQRIVRNTTGFTTHDDTMPRNYKLTSYTDPQAGGRWRPVLLDSMQFGMIEMTIYDAQITTIWALVETDEPREPTITGSIATFRGAWSKIVGAFVKIRSCCK